MNTIEQLRAGHVRRWHIVAMAREQTVAEHSHRVVVLTEAVLEALELFSWDDNLTLNAMRLAHIHDRHEVKLGDIPTPGKAYIRLLGGDPEDAALALDPEYAELMGCCGPGGSCPMAGEVVKLADLLEAMNWLGLFGVGTHAALVWEELRGACALQIDKMFPTRLPGPQAPGRVKMERLMRDLNEGKQFK